MENIKNKIIYIVGLSIGVFRLIVNIPLLLTICICAMFYKQQDNDIQDLSESDCFETITMNEELKSALSDYALMRARSLKEFQLEFNLDEEDILTPSLNYDSENTFKDLPSIYKEYVIQQIWNYFKKI